MEILDGLVLRSLLPSGSRLKAGSRYPPAPTRTVAEPAVPIRGRHRTWARKTPESQQPQLQDHVLSLIPFAFFFFLETRSNCMTLASNSQHCSYLSLEFYTPREGLVKLF